MSAAAVSIPHIWPECPAGFDLNGLALVLLTLPASMRRAKARLVCRTVLRELSGRLLGLPEIDLIEGPSGPELQGIGVSISYAGNRVLLGLSRDNRLGVDIVSIEPFPETAELCRLYLPQAARDAVLNGPHDAQCERFALAWAQTEACCKCLGLPLTEIDAAREQAYSGCKLVDCGQIIGYRIAVAVRAVRKTSAKMQRQTAQ